MSIEYEPVIGLEIHAVLETRSKMFDDAPVVDSTHDSPNVAVSPVSAGMPGVLPVINARAVDYALRVALALECDIAYTSIFERKSYFYPDLPKGYQISQYQQPLARDGRMLLAVEGGEQFVRIRRVHLEEDTGKLTHMHENGEAYTLVDLNRAGIPLLEIVTEPDMHSVEAVRACAYGLRAILRYLGVNSGDMEKGLLRIEPNVSVRPGGAQELGTRVEIKNLNSFRSLERALTYEITRQTELLQAGGQVVQETLGWDDEERITLPQRSKEQAEDYRYFPEPDLPPLVLDPQRVEELRVALPELPYAKHKRFQDEYALSAYDASLLVAEQPIANFFEAVCAAASDAPPKQVAHWITGDLFAYLNEKDQQIEDLSLTPGALGELIQMLVEAEINMPTAREVFAEMLNSGGSAERIVARRGLRQISDVAQIAALVARVLAENPEEVSTYLGGKEALAQWFFGQVMRAAAGKADPQVLRAELGRQLSEMKVERGV